MQFCLKICVVALMFEFSGCCKKPELTFVQACKEKRFDIVKTWKHPPINQQDEFDTTPLGYAVLNKNYKMAKFLLEKGADPHGKLLTDCIIYRSVLAEAYRQDNYPMISLLKKYRADLNHRDKNGMTELHRSVLFEYAEIEKLLKAGLDAKAVDNDGCTVFFYFPSMNNMGSDEMDKMVKLFQKYGADINRPMPHHGLTPYEKALKGEETEKAEIFKKNGAKVRSQGNALR